jgi:hypothetical protein
VLNAGHDICGVGRLERDDRTRDFHLNGIVMNGPMPTICVMLIAAADSRPTDRWNRRPSSRSSSAADAF